MIESMRELEALISASARPGRISMISEPEGPAAGLQVRIDHGDTEPAPVEGMGANAETFPLFAYFSIKKEAWADAERAARLVKQAIISTKKNWIAGGINREDSDGVYTLRLLVTCARVFRP